MSYTKSVLQLFMCVLLTGVFIGNTQAQDWQLVWSDEFDGDELDESKWSYQYGTGASEGLTGWGNNELQYYTDREDNIFVQNGNLHIVAREESYGGKNYTSARIRTIDNGDWRYGRFEIRAKMPIGQGIWPAIWMMPTDDVYGGWAASGEIDIMEYLGHEPDQVHGTLHYGGGWPDNVYSGDSYQLDEGTFSDDFHTFTLEWENGEMRWYVDGEHYQTQNHWYTQGHDFPAPFDQRFHMIMNVAVGGDWPGNPDHTTEFPQEMVIDYVRVYQDADAPARVSLPMTFEDEFLNWEEAFTNFDGGDVSVVDNPYPDELNGSGRVGKMIKDGGEFWGGAWFELDRPITFDTENNAITMKVWSPREDVPVAVKVEQTDGDEEYEMVVPTTTSGEWEELTWDMNGAGFDETWDIVTLIFDLEAGQIGDGSENFTWYFDELYVSGIHTTTSSEAPDKEVPQQMQLGQNYPNPFNPTTNITFSLPEAVHATLGVYNLLGQRVAMLKDEYLTSGQHSVTFDASDLASGTYIYRLQAGNQQITRSLTLVK